jgi:hypothetical protein
MKKIFRIEDLVKSVQGSLQQSIVKPVRGKIQDPINFQVVDFKISIPLYINSVEPEAVTFQSIDVMDMMAKGKIKEVEQIQFTRVDISLKPTITENIEDNMSKDLQKSKKT